jgi:hypothetical protein
MATCEELQAEIDALNAQNTTLLTVAIPNDAATLAAANAAVTAAQATQMAAMNQLNADTNQVSVNNGQIRQIQAQMSMQGC